MSSTKEVTPPKIGANNLRFISFNVCGLRNVMNYEPWSQNKTLKYMFDQLKGDVVCFQEVRTQAKDVPYSMAVVPGYSGYHSFPHVKKGYSGVAVYVKDGIQVIHAEDGLTGWLESKDFPKKTYRELEQEDLDSLINPPKERNESIVSFPQCIGEYPEDVNEALGKEIDSEGRSVVLDLGFCVLFGLYCPANSLGNKEEYRNNYFKVLDTRVRNLVKAGREVVVMGDLNIARELYDTGDGMSDYLKRIGQTQLIHGLSVGLLEAAHQSALNNWRVSSPQRILLQQWLGSPARVHKTDSSHSPSCSTNSTEPRILRDLCREKHPNRMGMYTCEYIIRNDWKLLPSFCYLFTSYLGWDQRTKARERNFGMLHFFYL